MYLAGWAQDCYEAEDQETACSCWLKSLVKVGPHLCAGVWPLRSCHGAWGSVMLLNNQIMHPPSGSTFHCWSGQVLHSHCLMHVSEVHLCCQPGGVVVQPHAQ
jgi:hypothetical protein